MFLTHNPDDLFIWNLTHRNQHVWLIRLFFEIMNFHQETFSYLIHLIFFAFGSSQALFIALVSVLT